MWIVRAYKQNQTTIIMKAIINILIQFVWVSISIITGGLIAMYIFESPLLKSIFSGVFSIFVYFLLASITYIIKAAKDPDVQAASNLGMSITRFRHYQRLWDEYQEYMKEHGIYSRESEEKFKEIYSQIKNPNEWRRYGQYREELQRKEMEETIDRIRHDN